MPASLNPNLCASCSTSWGTLEPLGGTCSTSWAKQGLIDVLCDIDWGILTPLDPTCELQWLKRGIVDLECELQWLKRGIADLECELQWLKRGIADIDCEFRWGRREIRDINCEFRWVKREIRDINCEFPWALTEWLDLACMAPWELFAKIDAVCVADISPIIPNIPIITSPCVILWATGESIIVIDQDVTFTVLPNTPIPLLGANINIDIESWLWSFSATTALHADLQYLWPVPGPIPARLSINGYHWFVQIERLSRNYQYGEGSYNISGRSDTAFIDAPQAAKQTKTFASDTNAEAICQDELSGLTPEVTLTWDLPFWYIGAGIYSVSNMTKLQIIKDVVGTVGGFVTTNYYTVGTPQTLSLHAKPRYIKSPKYWHTAPPVGPVIAETLTPSRIFSLSPNTNPQPKYDYMYCTGVNAGVITCVKRDGAPFINAKPTVSTPLILTKAVATERGRIELDMTGYDQTIYNITTPLPVYGGTSKPILLIPGDIINVTDLFSSWVGMVRSTSISVNSASGRTVTPGVTQTIEVERHHLPSETWDE
jgi:hypothetical protein